MADIPRKPKAHLQREGAANCPPMSGPRMGPMCGPSKKMDMAEARFFGSVMSATVPAPTEATALEPRA